MVLLAGHKVIPTSLSVSNQILVKSGSRSTAPLAKLVRAPIVHLPVAEVEVGAELLKWVMLVTPTQAPGLKPVNSLVSFVVWVAMVRLSVAQDHVEHREDSIL